MYSDHPAHTGHWMKRNGRKGINKKNRNKCTDIKDTQLFSTNNEVCSTLHYKFCTAGWFLKLSFILCQTLVSRLNYRLNLTMIWQVGLRPHPHCLPGTFIGNRSTVYWQRLGILLYIMVIKWRPLSPPPLRGSDVTHLSMVQVTMLTRITVSKHWRIFPQFSRLFTL